MKALMRPAALLAFAVVGLFFLWFAWVYATAPKLLWFHDAAVPAEAKAGVKPLYFALMNLIGGATGALGLLGLFVTFTSIRRGDKMAASAVAVAYGIAFAMAAVTAEELRAATGAPVAWHLMGIGLAVTALGLGCQMMRPAVSPSRP